MGRYKVTLALAEYTERTTIFIVASNSEEAGEAARVQAIREAKLRAREVQIIEVVQAD